MGEVVRQNESVAAFFSKTSTILGALVPLSNMLNLLQLCGYAAHCGRWHAAVFIGKCSSKYTWYKCVFVCSPSVHTMLEKWWSSKEGRRVLKTRQEALTILLHSINDKAAFELCRSTTLRSLSSSYYCASSAYLIVFPTELSQQWSIVCHSVACFFC